MNHYRFSTLTTVFQSETNGRNYYNNYNNYYNYYKKKPKSRGTPSPGSLLVSRQNEPPRIHRCPHQPRVLCIRFSGAPRVFILLTGAAETYPVRPYKKNKMKYIRFN